MTTIVRDQLLDAACEATGLDDFGDVPFLEALDVLLDSFNHDVDLAEPVGNAFVAMVTGLSSACSTMNRASSAWPWPQFNGAIADSAASALSIGDALSRLRSLLTEESSAARRVVLFQPECRPGDSHDDTYTDGEEHSTKHLLQSVPGM